MLLEIIQPKQDLQPGLISTPIQQNQGWEFLNKYPFAKNSDNSIEKMRLLWPLKMPCIWHPNMILRKKLHLKYYKHFPKEHKVLKC